MCDQRVLQAVAWPHVKPTTSVKSRFAVCFTKMSPADRDYCRRGVMTTTASIPAERNTQPVTSCRSPSVDSAVRNRVSPAGPLEMGSSRDSGLSAFCISIRKRHPLCRSLPTSNRYVANASQNSSPYPHERHVVFAREFLKVKIWLRIGEEPLEALHLLRIGLLPRWNTRRSVQLPPHSAKP